MTRDRIPPEKSVLLVGNFLSESHGTRGVSEDLALRLRLAGWNVITTSNKPGRSARLADMLRTVWDRRSCYAVANVDVFSGPAFLWAEAAALLLSRLGKPVILTLRGGNLPLFARQRPGRVSRVLRSANAVASPSHYLSETMSEYGREVRVLPNAIDVTAYDHCLRASPSPNLAWLRAFHTLYRPDIAVKTVAELSADFPDISLTMYGPDKGDGSLQRTQDLAENLGLTEQVHFPGAVPKSQVAPQLSQHDIFLNTTTAESFGVSVMEAAACGLPIITTNVGELPYLWQHDQDALLVPVGDAHAIAEAARRVLTDPRLASRLSTNARRKVEQFDWSVILPQWENLLEAVAKKQ